MGSVILTFIAAVFIIYLSYVVSKYVGRGMGMNKNGNSHYMRVVDQLMVGQDRYVAVVQAGDKYLLIGVTSQQISLLQELDPEDLIPLAPIQGNSTPKAQEFRELLNKFGKMTQKGGKEDV